MSKRLVFDPYREPYAAATRLVLIDGGPVGGCVFARDGALSAVVFKADGFDRRGRPMLSARYGAVRVVDRESYLRGTKPAHRSSPQRGRR